MARIRRKNGNIGPLSRIGGILAAVAVVAAVFFLFYVQSIEVEGNTYTDTDEILSYVEKDALSCNALYLKFKYRFTNYKMPGSISSIGIHVSKPWSVKVRVTEKPLIGYINDGSEYIYFDSEGTVVLKSDSLSYEVPKIEGVDVGSAKLYKPLKLKSDKLLEAMLNVAQEVKNYQLEPDRILCADDGMELYFGQVRVMLGTEVTTEKMAQVAPILEKLGGQLGTLHLEHFTSDSGTITFTAGAYDIPGDTSDAAESKADTGDGGKASEDASKDEETDGDESQDWDEDADTGSGEDDSYTDEGAADLFEGYTLDDDGYYYGADGYYDADGNFYEY